MNEQEGAFRLAVAAMMLAGFAVRFYYQARMSRVQRIAARSLSRDRFLYWVVFASYLLAIVYASSSLLDAAHVDLPAALRWTGAPFAR